MICSRLANFLMLSSLTSICTAGASAVLGETAVVALSENAVRQLSQVRSPSTPASSTAIDSQIEQGLTYYRQGQYQAAQQRFVQAQEQAITQNEPLKQGQSLIYLSLVQQQLQDWTQAEDSIQSALDLFQDLSVPSRYLARAKNTQGRLSFSLGQTEAALEQWEAAERHYTESDDPEGILGSVINQAQALTALGYHHRACKSLFRAIDAEGDCNISNDSRLLETTIAAFHEQPNPQVRSFGLQTLGNLLRLSGNYKSAETLLISLESESQSPAARRSLLISLAKLQQAFFNRQLRYYQRTSYLPDKQTALEQTLDRAEQSVNYFRQVEQLSSTPTAWSTLETKLLQLKLFLDLKKDLDGLSQNSPTLQVAIASIPTLQQALLDSNLDQFAPRQSIIQGQLLFAKQLLALSSEDPQQSSLRSRALQYANIALSGARDIQDHSSESEALGVLGSIYEQNQQWQEAVQLTQQALVLANSRQDHQQIAQWQWQLGRLSHAQSDPTQALGAYQASVQSLGIVRQNLRVMRNEVEFSFRENVEPVYRQYVSLLLQDNALNNSQDRLKQALQVFDDFQIAELEDFLNCDLQLRAKSTPDESSAFIYPIVLKDRLEVIIQLPNQDDLIQYSTSIPIKQLNTTLTDLRRESERTYVSEPGLKLSQQVYDWIIRPALPDLETQNIETLVFVLDGPLRNIPLGALHDGEQYLIEQGFNLALLPGLELFESQSAVQSSLKALTFGLAKSEGKPPLPDVLTELDNINELIDAKNFVNQAFSKEALEKELVASSTPIVHLATHGQFSSNPDETYISAYDQDISGDELSQLLQSRANSPNLSPIELLVLSACKTAAGDPRAILGLAGIAIQSGARSTLSSLWAVNDVSTALLMSQFYSEIVDNPSMTKAEALRNAQVELLNTPGYESPRFWAAFVLVGDWK